MTGILGIFQKISIWGDFSENFPYGGLHTGGGGGAFL